MTIYEIISQLKYTNSMNEKREILREHSEDLLFQKVLTYMYDPRITFGIKKIPKYKPTRSYTLENTIDKLELLVRREITGNNAIDFLSELLSGLSKEDAWVLKLIIGKKSKAGFGTSLINNEMGDFKVYKPNYMGAVPYSRKKVDNIFKKYKFGISEVKMDGKYLNVVCTDKVFIESRKGIPNTLMGALEKDAMSIRKKYHEDIVLNGEVLLSPVLEGKMDRYTSNGILSSFNTISKKYYDGEDITKEKLKLKTKHGYTLEEVRDLIIMVVWDFIPTAHYNNSVWNEPRIDRLETLEELVQDCKDIKLVEYKKVHTHKEAVQHFQEMLSRGEEGTILKGSEGLWKDGKPVWQSKIKLVIDLDLKFVSGNYGTVGTKNEGLISSINVESSCGLLKTSPGGMKESDMEYFTEHLEELTGKIIEVKCSGVSQDVDGNYSLLHPGYVKIRDDKDEADSLEDVLKIERMAKELNL